MTVSELKCMYCGEPIKYDGPQTCTERWWIHSSTDRYQCIYTNPDLTTHAAPAEGNVAVQANDVERLTQRVQELEKALKSAASTAHYRGVLRGASDVCHGSFDECTNCARWKTILAGTEKEAAK